MAINDLAPGYVKLKYTVGSNPTHEMTIPVNPSDAGGGTWNLIPKSGGAGSVWTSAIGAYITAALADLMHTSCTFGVGELYTKDYGEAPVFRASANFALAGTITGTVQVASQLVITLRTSVGGLGKVILLDQPFAVNSKWAATAFDSGPISDAVAYLVSTSSVVWGRDGAYFSAGMRAMTKTNDTLRKQYGLV